jgi:hypothetical protein
MKVNTANSRPPRPRRRLREDSILRAYGLIASVVVAGCAGGTPPPPGGTSGTLPTPRATAVGTPSGSPVEKTIGLAGGTLASADDLLTIDVPTGALGTDTQLGIQPLTGTAPNGLGSGFRLTPTPTTFSSPVKLTFKPSADQLTGTALALTGIGYQDSSGVWRWMRGIERDEANGRVSVTTTHFSDWSLLAGAQLRPPSASVKTGETLTLTAVECWTEEEELAPLPGEQLAPLPPRFDCDPAGEQLAPLPLTLSNWSVNGIGGGNSTVGTVSAQGVTATYRAPSVRPDPSTVAVSVDVSNLKLGSQTFAKTVLVSNVTIVDAGEVATWRGPVTFSWSEVDAFYTTSWQAEGTVEFGQREDRSTHTSFMTPTNGSPCQISNYRREATKYVETCTGNAASRASILGTLVVRKSPSEYGLTLLFSGMVPSTCTNPWNSTQVEQNASGQVGNINDGYGNPLGCRGMKFTASSPDARSLTGSATWNCPTSADSSFTATLTWSLTGS